MAFKKIGVLGGMGPAAAAEFYQKLIKLCQKKYGAILDEEYPHIIINSVPFVGVDETGIVNSEKLQQQVKKEINNLQNHGCEILVTPCNTLDTLLKKTLVPITIKTISIIDACIQEINANKHKSVGLLASETTIRTKTYQKAINNIKFICPTKSEQLKINKCILNVMGGNNDSEDFSNLKKIMERMHSEGAECILLACTELPLAMKGSFDKIPLYDSTDILVSTTLENSKNLI